MATRSQRNQAALEGIQALSSQRRETNRTHKHYVVGKPLRIPVSVQQRYVAGIESLTHQMIEETRDKIVSLMKSDAAISHFVALAGTVGIDAASISSQMRVLINSLKSKYDQLFGKLSFGLSADMADSLNRSSSTAVRSSIADLPNLKHEAAKLTIAVKSLDAPTLNILRAAAARSASFITSIPEQHLNTVAAHVYDSIAKGGGIADLTSFFDTQGNTTRNWARNTAMDQTRKTYNGLNIGRMKKVGVTVGEWIHSGGSQFPRELHEAFDGEHFDLNIGAPIGDDGENVMPGDSNNCRCSFAPVIDYANDAEGDDGGDE